MIKSVTIENFRCFKIAKLDKCRRVNLLVGRNASGKTAVLEALFLALGATPEIAARLRQWRGYESRISGLYDQVDAALFSDLFHMYNVDSVVAVSLSGTGSFRRSVKLRRKTLEQFVPTAAGEPASALSAFEFDWTRDGRSHHIARAKITAGGIMFPGIDTKAPNCMFLSVGVGSNNEEMVRRFSKLDIENKSGAFVNAMIREFDFITSIDIQSYFGVPMLHASVRGVGRKIPISAISSGVCRLSNILLGIIDNEGGVVLIDEIDNGFHYSRLDSIWSAISGVSRDHDVQVFASTHSGECIRALEEASRKDSGDVSLIRSSMDNGAGVLEQFVGLSAARFAELR